MKLNFFVYNSEVTRHDLRAWSAPLKSGTGLSTPDDNSKFPKPNRHDHGSGPDNPRIEAETILFKAIFKDKMR